MVVFAPTGSRGEQTYVWSVAAMLFCLPFILLADWDAIFIDKQIVVGIVFFLAFLCTILLALNLDLFNSLDVFVLST